MDEVKEFDDIELDAFALAAVAGVREVVMATVAKKKHMPGIGA